MVHSWATDTDDPTVQPRWGKIGKQRIEDAGPLPPERMETVDDEILKYTFDFMDRARKDNKPFFVWLNPTRMHIFTFLSPKYKALEGKDNYGLQEAGTAQFDDIVGAVFKKLEDIGLDENTIIGVTTDNGTEVLTWPDGGNTPFKGAKGMTTEGGFRVPMIVRWPGEIPAGKVENASCQAWIGFQRSWRPPVTQILLVNSKKGKQLGDRENKVHLDGYNQLDMLTGRQPAGPSIGRLDAR